MNKDQQLENYLSISPNKFGIYLFDPKNSKNVYKEELLINQNNNYLNLSNLKKFLDNNIFKIEKLSGKFVENIFLIFEDKSTFNLEIGIKKKNYELSVTKEYLKNSLIEAKDLFRKNYQNQEIMHMIINKYFIKNKSYLSFQENLKNHLALEIQFKSIPNNIIYDLNKILGNYQIKIIKYLDGDCEIFFSKDIELSVSHRIINGYNENEVIFIQKNPKKLAFLKNFFNYLTKIVSCNISCFLIYKYSH